MSRNESIVKYEFYDIDHYTDILNAFKGLFLFTQKAINDGSANESDKSMNCNCDDMLRFFFVIVCLHPSL